MNTLTSLLANAAEEVRAYDNQNFVNGADVRRWMDRLANDMIQASLITDKRELELAILNLARRLIDSGPMQSDFCPSFDTALGAVQRSRKREGR